MAHKLFQVGVKALVTDGEGRVLLLKATKGFHDEHWDLPGGRIEDAQTAQEALRREIEEELGVKDIENGEFFSACISNFELNFDDIGTVGLVLMAYTVELPKDAVITLSEEHTDYEWVTRSEAAKRLVVKYPEEFTAALAV
jgi:8-oxo-dGTP pyrophosphatase MutT (NUDIX family)